MFSSWARRIGGYFLGPILGAGVIYALIEIIAAIGHLEVDLMVLVLGLYGGASLAWIVVAVLDQGRLVWRALMTWVPVTPIVMMLVFIAFQTTKDKWELDGLALAAWFYLLLLAVMAPFCALGSVAALVYRPGDRLNRQIQ